MRHSQSTRGRQAALNKALPCVRRGAVHGESRGYRPRRARSPGWSPKLITSDSVHFGLGRNSRTERWCSAVSRDRLQPRAEETSTSWRRRPARPVRPKAKQRPSPVCLPDAGRVPGKGGEAWGTESRIQPTVTRGETGVDPLLWSPPRCGWRISRCDVSNGRTRPSFGRGWSTSFERAEPRRACQESSTSRNGRFGCGSGKPNATVVSGATARRRMRSRSWPACAGRTSGFARSATS